MLFQNPYRGALFFQDKHIRKATFTFYKNTFLLLERSLLMVSLSNHLSYNY